MSVASQISTHWVILVCLLKPSLFSVDKIDEIKEKYPEIFSQARKALTMWTSQFVDKATRQLLIKAMCDMRVGCRIVANAAFGEQLVAYVSPLE